MITSMPVSISPCPVRLTFSCFRSLVIAPIGNAASAAALMVCGPRHSCTKAEKPEAMTARVIATRIVYISPMLKLARLMAFVTKLFMLEPDCLKVVLVARLTSYSSIVCACKIAFSTLTELSALTNSAPSATPSAATIDPTDPEQELPAVKQPRLWCDDGWTAKVIKNEDDDGWAVAMIKDGEPEPALVGPWTMGRDKKNPKPLDSVAFSTLVKTASEFVRRHEQQLHASLHQSITVTAKGARITVNLDIVPDEDNPYAQLSAFDDAEQQLAQVRVSPAYVLKRASAVAWIESDFATPRSR